VCNFFFPSILGYQLAGENICINLEEEREKSTIHRPIHTILTHRGGGAFQSFYTGTDLKG
jgi:hypothetical protein